EGQMGNSEVGHMNLGAGRIVYQMLVKINMDAESGNIAKNNVLLDAFKYAKEESKRIHFIGLVSDGGVHSHINHLKALLTAAHQFGYEHVYVHAFTDGRDCSPTSGIQHLEDLAEHMKKTVGKIATVTGRYYAMDRDKRWERIKLAYDAMVHGIGKPVTSFSTAMQASYDEGVTDEFIKPLVGVDDLGKPIGNIQDGDVVLCFNFRTDRGREITQVLTQQDFPEFGMKTLNLYYLTMTNYDETFRKVKVLYDNEMLKNTLGEVLAKAGKKQIRIAETEKYPHVTFFFSGGDEKEFEGEKRILCPSPKVATYDLKPEMSAEDIRDAIIPELNKREADFVCLNFANPDMVGHTGVFAAAVKACETVDRCAQAVVEAGLANGYITLLLADHGNSDIMINPDGTPHTAHTTNPVPCILIDNEYKGKIKNGVLGNVAPTILELMGIEKPKEMTCESLLVK
ncbi:MAG: 2,3-bisphosphoglycerate-independent phosphoglycerate mutase, partial [Flammeovirgaceae bacterium]|nr:2,3-bisphosphoglycerate-independent phosphoglycerate mutase [Flammeovirgaceae bacterium]MDW8288242.1 2,3-bisphosphoglycerate-independent phosphoglycerate mutase [Flammeovirgaceae bacterium]